MALVLLKNVHNWPCYGQKWRACPYLGIRLLTITQSCLVRTLRWGGAKKSFSQKNLLVSFIVNILKIDNFWTYKSEIGEFRLNLSSSNFHDYCMIVLSDNPKDFEIMGKITEYNIFSIDF